MNMKVFLIKGGQMVDERFLVDSMLGKLAKWLRVMGYDTHYQPFYRTGEMDHLIEGERRWLVSRHRMTVSRFDNAVLVISNHVDEQLRELQKRNLLSNDRTEWFSRCLSCNKFLISIKNPEALETVKALAKQYQIKNH